MAKHLPENRLTCQCCGRAILANTGVIAHHGFRRPQGWQCQVGTCMGARELPFEASRDCLANLIASIDADLIRHVTFFEAIEDETTAIAFDYQSRSRQIGRYVDRSVMVTRDTFDMVQPAYQLEMSRNSIWSFDDLKRRVLDRTHHEINAIKTELRTQQARYDGWKQTLRFADNQWVAA